MSEKDLCVLGQPVVQRQQVLRNLFKFHQFVLRGVGSSGPEQIQVARGGGGTMPCPSFHILQRSGFPLSYAYGPEFSYGVINFVNCWLTPLLTVFVYKGVQVKADPPRIHPSVKFN